MQRRDRSRSAEKKDSSKSNAMIFELEGPMLDLEAFKVQYAHMELTPERFKGLYGAYQRAYEKNRKDTYFEKYHTQPFIIDKYHPKQRLLYEDERIATSKLQFQEFLMKQENILIRFNQGTLSELNYNVTEAQLNECCDVNWEDEDVPFWELPLREGVQVPFALQTGPTAFIPTIPQSVTRFDLFRALSKLAGYLHFTTSEPSKLTLNRIGWVEFDTQENLDLALAQDIQVGKELLTLESAKIKTQSIRILRTYTEESLKTDLECQYNLIKFLDESKSIVANPLLEEALREPSDPIFYRQLDIFSYYLRFVHCYCYCSGAQFSDRRTLIQKAGCAFLRLEQKNFKSFIQWQEIIQTLAKQSMVKVEDIQILKLVEDMIVAKCLKSRNMVSASVQTVYPCAYCDKNFGSSQFVLSHITKRHDTIYAEEKQKFMIEILDKIMEDTYKKEQQTRIKLQKQVFDTGKLTEPEQAPRDWVLRVGGGNYKDLDSLAPERLPLTSYLRKEKAVINYNDI